jgi:hypothetical protein
MKSGIIRRVAATVAIFIAVTANAANRAGPICGNLSNGDYNFTLESYMKRKRDVFRFERRAYDGHSRDL